ncbi:hypothetical protein AGMMS49960_20810 [Betaproteobacteria bacterium]|nr:hypothetical protein AGMMS49960_20810 [Betaproteobacteria bacterium]
MLNRLKTFDVGLWLLPLLLLWVLLAAQPLGAKTAEKSSNESSGWNAGVSLSFGNQPTITSQLRLPGQYEDEETGLHYNFRRCYEPETGRYITSDPIGVEGGINLYQYAGSDPVNLADPTGEVAFIPFMIAADEMYARCYAYCMLVGTAINHVTDACEELPWKDCSKECLNPLNWSGRGVGRRGVRAAQRGANLEASALRTALEKATPTPGNPNQLMVVLDDGTRVIFRRDFGAEAHRLGGPFQGAGKIDHYNIEIQVPKPGSRGGVNIIENVHVVPDGKGGYTWWGTDGVIKK